MYADTITDFHPDLFKIDVRSGGLTSKLLALKNFSAGDRICMLEGLISGPKRYYTIQCGPSPSDHKEVNSDLYYVNHSCGPNVAFDVSSTDSSEWHFRALKDIDAGDELRYFYPSTEWDMDQPFECICKEKNCLGAISGASNVSKDKLKQHGFINQHIWKLCKLRDVDLEDGSVESPLSPMHVEEVNP